MNYSDRICTEQNTPKKTRNALETNSPPERLLKSLPFHTGLHFNQLPSICPHGLQPMAPPSDLILSDSARYVPHTCRQPIRTVQPIVSFLRYSPNRTGMSWHPFLSHPHRPQSSPRAVIILVEIYISLSRLLLPETIDGFQPYHWCACSCLKLSKVHSTDCLPDMCLLHWLLLFYKQSTEGTHSGFSPKLARSLFNLPYFTTVSASFSVLSAAFS